MELLITLANKKNEIREFHWAKNLCTLIPWVKEIDNILEKNHFSRWGVQEKADRNKRN